MKPGQAKTVPGSNGAILTDGLHLFRSDQQTAQADRKPASHRGVPEEATMSDTVEASITALIAEAAESDPAKISRDTELSELEIDSLALTEIVMEVEDQHDIEIDLNTAEAWETLKTVGDLVDMVKKIIADQH